MQALQGTLFTWGLTALGAGTAVLLKGEQRKLLDISLGFAAGVMLAASYWSLLEPALEMAAGLGTYGERGQWAFLPVSTGFFVGALFVYGADVLMSRVGVTSPADLLIADKVKKEDPDSPQHPGLARCESGEATSVNVQEGLRRRRAENGEVLLENLEVEERRRKEEHWRRILLLIVAVTVHNIPEGLAVGVGFGAIGKTSRRLKKHYPYLILRANKVCHVRVSSQSGPRYWHSKFSRGCGKYRRHFLIIKLKISGSENLHCS